MRQLEKRIKKAKKFGELVTIINNEKYFSEIKENEYDYFVEWMMNMRKDETFFATLSTYSKYDEYQYHIITDIDEDVENIKNKVEKLYNDYHEEKIIDEYGYYDKIREIFDNIKIKNSELECVC